MLRFDALCKTYPNGTEALRSVSLTLRESEIAAIVGGSGCGKTTLLRVAAGLEMPSSGAVKIDGATLRGPHPAVGVIFQEPRLLPWLTVAENVGFGLPDLAPALRHARARDVLARVGLADYEGHWPRELSGGQAQRIAIGRALAPRPQVLLMDEPFSALDAMTRAALHDQVLGLWAVDRPTLLIVTHDVEEAIVLADRVIVMQPRPGRIFAELPITLPRPRNRLSSGFTDAKRRVLEALDGSIDARASADVSPGLWW